MANNENIGKIPGFNISAAELDRKIKEYKEEVASDKILFPSWSDFREYLGIRQDVLNEVVERGYFSEGAADSAYYTRACALIKMSETCANYLATHPNWQGRNGAKSLKVMEKEDPGWGKKAESAQSVPMIKFGGGDPRAARAGK